MGKNRRIRPFQGICKTGKGILPIKKPPARHQQLRPQAVKGPGHRIVFKAADRHLHSGLYQAPDGNIQAMGAVGGEHHLLRSAVKEPACPFTATVHRFRSAPGSAVAAPARIGAVLHGPGHRLPHLPGLMQGGGTEIQIGHRLISSSVPSGVWI